MTQASSLRTHAINAFNKRTRIDNRALAVFRILIGTLLLADLALRARNIRVFYTDTGVLPRTTLQTLHPGISQLSLHTLSGTVEFQTVLFITAAIAAICIITGYRTRLAIACSFILLVSLHARNPVVLNGGDSVLRRLVFWSIFLPLGSHWAVDATQTTTNTRNTPSLIERIGTLGLFTQIIFIYTTNAAFKLTSGTWADTNALHTALQRHAFTTPLGVTLTDYPTLLHITGKAWILLLIGSTLLLLTTHWKRGLIAIAFISVHAVMAATMWIGLFPIISITALIPFLPPVFWTHATTRLNRIKQKLCNSETKHEPTTDDNTTPHPKNNTKNTNTQPASTIRTALQYTVVIIGITIIVTLAFWNAAAIGFVQTPEPVAETVPPSENSWNMFTEPSTQNVWITAPTITTTGTQTDAIHGTKTTPTPPHPTDAWYPSSRWRKYLFSLVATDTPALINSTATGLCNTPQTHTETPHNLSIHEYRYKTSNTSTEIVTSNKLTTITC